MSEFNTRLVYRESSRTARGTQRNPFLKKQNKRKEKKEKEKKKNIYIRIVCIGKNTLKISIN